LRRNTRGGSRRNISAHYDLSNEFFELILDETLTYSCGHFEHAEATLEEASLAKYDRLCRKLELQPGGRVIEIGTGWGGFAMHAARHYGCNVTTTTISAQQHAGALDRIRRAGLDDSIRVLGSDYRDLEGTWDKLVSIEMIEAVGHQYYRTFFAKCASLLAPHGLAAIQSITIQDRLYEQALRETDFIKEYIFPGSSIPSVSVLLQSASGTDMRLVHADDQGPHYARTLREWKGNMDRNAGRIAALGFDSRFRRLWEFYFAYCEGGFEEGVLGNAQLLFAKPAAARTLRGSRFEWVTAA
jgi:cyclopropane-fatty-acyl-phospholipid synthase